jgi:NAD(P)-dependent dehydrogenase (short-subunit alcohol dehydrogenase family)
MAESGFTQSMQHTAATPEISLIDLHGKTVLVTGGSRGIGASTVRVLARAGARIALHYGHGRQEAETIADEIGSACRTFGADLAAPRSAYRLWDDACAWAGRIEVVVNNAAVVTAMTVDDDSETWDRVWQQTLAVNVRAAADLCRAAIHSFRARGGGTLISVASRAAFRGDDPHLMHYAASKAALVALTRSIARGYARDNILAYIVAPGFVRTERQEGVMLRRGEDVIVRDIPLGEMARPEDIANVIAFLASGLARHATGATIDINGASYFH